MRFSLDNTLKILVLVFSEAEIERIEADTPEPAGVHGWEVLEAEGMVTDKQEKSSKKEQERSGLVKAIAGVFHKG